MEKNESVLINHQVYRLKFCKQLTLSIRNLLVSAWSFIVPCQQQNAGHEYKSTSSLPAYFIL